MERNRPVGVWLERSTTLPNVCTQVFLAETPQLYAGDLIDSKSVGFANLGGKVNATGTNDLILETAAFSPSSASLLLSLVQRDDLIRFNYQGAWFRVGGGPVAVPAVSEIRLWFCHPEQRFHAGPDGAWGWAGVDDDNNGIVDDGSEAGWPWQKLGSNAHSVTGIGPGCDDIWLSPIPASLASADPIQSFQIQRFPHKRVTGSLEIPAGTVVDLGFSGIGVDGIHFAPGGPADKSPVIVMFSPNGNVERIVYQGSSHSPTGNVHFLVGRAEGIQDADSELPAKPNTIPMSAAAPMQMVTYDVNVSAVTSIWVSVGAKNGNAAATENLWLLTNDAALGQFSLRASLMEARKRAARSQSVGGI